MTTIGHLFAGPSTSRDEFDKTQLNQCGRINGRDRFVLPPDFDVEYCAELPDSYPFDDIRFVAYPAPATKMKRAGPLGPAFSFLYWEDV